MLAAALARVIAPTAMPDAQGSSETAAPRAAATPSSRVTAAAERVDMTVPKVMAEPEASPTTNPAAVPPMAVTIPPATRTTATSRADAFRVPGAGRPSCSAPLTGATIPSRRRGGCRRVTLGGRLLRAASLRRCHWSRAGGTSIPSTGT